MPSSGLSFTIQEYIKTETILEILVPKVGISNHVDGSALPKTSSYQCQ